MTSQTGCQVGANQRLDTERQHFLGSLERPRALAVAHPSALHDHAGDRGAAVDPERDLVAVDEQLDLVGASIAERSKSTGNAIVNVGGELLSGRHDPR